MFIVLDRPPAPKAIPSIFGTPLPWCPEHLNRFLQGLAAEEGPTALEYAWESGWELGYACVEADAPHGYTDMERTAFRNGWKEGNQSAEDAMWGRVADSITPPFYVDELARYEAAEIAECFGSRPPEGGGL